MSSGPRWAVRFRTNILYRLIRHWYLVKWKCNTVHHEGMFAQERWTPQSLQCGMSPCSQKSKKQKVSHFLRSSKNASQQIKKWKLLQLDTPTEHFHFLESHFRWWICRGWQILSSILCSLLFVSILLLRSVLNVKFITPKSHICERDCNWNRTSFVS